jgi:hypothetical protein
VTVIARDLSWTLIGLVPGDGEPSDLDPTDPNPRQRSEALPSFGSLDGIQLLFGEIFGSTTSWRMPMLAILAAFALSLFIGLRTGFVLGGGPLLLAAVSPALYDVVLRHEDEMLLAYEEPGDKHQVEHRFPPNEIGIRSTGRRTEADGSTWMEVETDAGDAWVDAEYLTLQVSAGAFNNDDNVEALAASFRAAIGTGELGEGIIGARGLYVSHFADPAYFEAEDLDHLFSPTSSWGWWDASGTSCR